MYMTSVSRKYTPSILHNRVVKAQLNFSTNINTSSSILPNHHNVKGSSLPYIESYRPRWPQQPVSTEIKNMVLPKRTVPDDVMRFEMKATMDHGQAIYYPHLQFNPADFKVKLWVSIDKVGLNNEEKKIFCEMVGPRFFSGSREVRLICNQFSNRVENKRYLVYLLESLLLESKKIYQDFTQGLIVDDVPHNA